MFLASRVVLFKTQAIGIFSSLELAKNACETDYEGKVGAGGITYLIEEFEQDVYDVSAPHVLHDYIPNPGSNTWSQAIVERKSSIDI